MKALAGLAFVAGCGRLGFDAISGDAIGSDLVTGDSPSSSCPAFAVFCDDFETGGLSRWTGPVLAPTGTVMVTPAAAHRGGFGLDAVMPPSGGNGAVAATCRQASPMSSGVLAVRAYVKTPSQINSFQGVFSLLNFSQCDGDPPEYVMVTCNGTSWAVAEGFSGSTPDTPGGQCMPPNTWTCVELDYTFSPPSFSFYANDVLTISGAAFDPSPSFDLLWLGVTRATTTGFEVFADDLVVANQHIGC